jgi:hypothetical protein
MGNGAENKFQVTADMKTVWPTFTAHTYAYYRLWHHSPNANGLVFVVLVQIEPTQTDIFRGEKSGRSKLLSIYMQRGKQKKANKPSLQ